MESEQRGPAVFRRLASAGTEHRFWYGLGLRSNTYFACLPGDDDPETRLLAARLIGLPISEHISEEEIDLVLSCLD